MKSKISYKTISRQIMLIPTTKATFKSYCLRNLGFGVIDINVSDDQVDDRIDEALQYFAQYHYDGVERMYLKHLITSADVTRARSNDTVTATDKLDSTLTADWLEGKNWIPYQIQWCLLFKCFHFLIQSETLICLMFVISYD